MDERDLLIERHLAEESADVVRDRASGLTRQCAEG